MLSYLTFSTTQGGADAFAVSSTQTGLDSNSGLCFRVREIVIEIPRVSNAAASAVEVALCRRTKAAMPLITDRDVILKRKVQSELSTNGVGFGELVTRYAYGEDDDLLIVESELFFAVDSNATTLTQTVLARIGYTVEKISAVDRLSILTQSLVT